MAGTPTFGALTNPADTRNFTLHLMDGSGDTWTETLYTAITATYTAINAWIVLYQLCTQASVYSVDEIHSWSGDADPDLADFVARGGVENGINLSFRDPDAAILRGLRVIAPVPEIMQGNQDIPLLTATPIANLITATVALDTDFNFRQAQYTARRERKNNPRVK